MNVRFGLACLSLLISCWCCTTSSVSAVTNGVRPRRQSRRATLNEYLTPPALPNAFRGPGFSRHPRNHQHHGGAPPLPQGSGPPSPSLPFRDGKILTASPTESPGYFARLMGWLNPFGGTPIQRPSPPQQQRPNNVHQDNFHSGHLQLLPPTNGNGPPAPSYGPPTKSYERDVSGQTLPHPPSPQGGKGYLPPQKTRNCNPCNQVPWMPLYHGINTMDSRYAASSSNVALLESLESTPNQNQDNGGTNNHRVPSFSQEVKTPDFGYGPPSSLPALDPKHQASPSPNQLNINGNNNNNNRNNNNYDKNFNYAQPEYRSPFTGPIPNPHLYPGAIPPLFKAKPFDSQPQDTSFDPPPILQFNQPLSSEGEIRSSNFGGGVNFGESSFVPSLDQSASFSGSPNQLNKQLSQDNGFNPPSIDHQYDQQFQSNGTSSFSFNSPIDHQQSSSHNFGTTLTEGYVDELPPGAEIVSSGPDDHFPLASLDENHASDNGAANSDYQQTLHSSINHETQSGSSSIAFTNGQTEPVGETNFQGVETSLENVKQSTSYGSQVSSDGQHVIHYEQSPIIDLSSIGEDEKRKNSNDSSASSSTSTGAIEDPPVILQNPDGTYGINATWSAEDSSKIVWPEDEEIGTNVATITASTLPREPSSESSSSVKFDNLGASSTDIPATTPNVQDNRSYTGYTEQLLRNDSGRQEQHFADSRNENRTSQQSHEQSEHAQKSQRELGGQSRIPETSRKQNQALLSPYPGLIRFENSDSYGFRLPDSPTGSAGEETFLKALMRSHPNLKKDGAKNDDQGVRQPGSREAWFDPRQIHHGAGFMPSRDQLQRAQNLGEEKLRSGNRQQGAKKNTQVQIIIPYTSQYTPKPFHPMREDWSSKTAQIHTQARKVPIFETNRDYLAQETRRVEEEVSQILQSLKNSSRAKEVTRSPNGAKANTSIDVSKLQKNIDNWTIQEYSKGTTASTTIPKFSRPYLSPSKKIPDEYLTTTELVVPSTNTIQDKRKEIGNVLAGFSFNDLEHEGSASDQVDVSHVQVSSHINEVSSVFPKIMETTTATSVVTPTIERDTWKQFSVSISPLNKERVYVVTPQSVSTLPTTRRNNKSYDKSLRNETTKISKKEPDLDHFESIERAYQVLPQAVNNLVVASTGPATLPLWGIMEHEKYASSSNDTTPESPILYAGHSKVSHTRQ